MILLDTLTTTLPQPTAVALGFFDGLHKGHRAVIDAALACREQGLAPAVFTFDTAHSRPPGKPGQMLLTQPQRLVRLEQMGLEYTVCPPFEELRCLSPEAFVDVLSNQLLAKRLFCGDNFRFGHKASAGIAELQELCRGRGMGLHVCEKVFYGGQPVSSTRIRQAVSQGKPEVATELLGYPFAIYAPVVAGKRLGRQLGFPTANQQIPQGLVQPLPGVYATTITHRGKSWPAVTNIGRQPTVGGQEIVCESYMVGFTGELYGEEISTALVAYLRPICRFDTVEALREQIQLDVQAAQKLLPSPQAQPNT